ncbi:hypothetical protein Lal_00034024 [Lupinus albus]|nr:hypothetical protein Lal_00034024 [Lupinus albus]
MYWQLEQSDKTSSAVDLDVLWVDAHKNKECVIPFTRVVGVGTVHNTPDAMLHNASIPPNHVRVAIDIAIEDDTLLPIHLDEDIITLGGL